MSEGIAIIAALPRELSALVRGWERREATRNVLVWTRGDAVAACAGMGAARAALACEAAMKARVVKTLVSAGLAGACDQALRVGDVVRASVVVDAKTGERFDAASASIPLIPRSGMNGARIGEGSVVVTGAAIASVREKARLREAYGAAAVEMEAAAVARIARAHRLEFRAVKAISDEADFALDGLERFASADGQFREGAFALHAALRPWMWGEVMKLGRNSAKAVQSLNEALSAEID